MRYTIPEIKSTLLNSIKNISKISWLFSTNPEKDFSRNRKLSFEKMMTSILCMGGGSLTNELMDCFSCSSDTPSTSAFVQQRAKILPEAFETLFRMFTDSIAVDSLYKGYRLLAVDGSDLQIATDKNDTDSYYPGTNGQKPYNLLHLNALYDLHLHNYTCFYAVHKNRPNTHTHFILNSVGLDGRKFNQSKSDLKKFKKFIESLCEKYDVGLSDEEDIVYWASNVSDWQNYSACCDIQNEQAMDEYRPHINDTYMPVCYRMAEDGNMYPVNPMNADGTINMIQIINPETDKVPMIHIVDEDGYLKPGF